MTPIDDPPSPPSARRPGPGPGTILLWASWFGLVGGGLELATFLAKCHYFAPRNYNASRNFPWMFPLAGLLIAWVPGVALALASFWKPWRGRDGAAPVIFALAFPTVLGLLFRMPIYTAVCLLLAAALAFRGAGFLAGHRDGFGRVVRRTLPALVGIWALAGLGCLLGVGRSSTPVPPAPAHGGPDVLLIVLDTVRAGSLSLHGYGRATSPNLERFAARGVRFDLAFSTAPWTAPSHAGMFTGRAAGDLSVGWDRPLDRSSPTLAEFLAGRGYSTAGFVANTTYCSYETGLDRGFAHYEDYDVTARSVLLCSAAVQRAAGFLEKHPLPGLGGAGAMGHRKDADRINRDVLGWLDSRPGDRPFFAFLNYYDAHHPYLAPGPAPGPPIGRGAESPGDVRMLRGWWAADKLRLPGRDLELARDSYDRCIAYLDDRVGRLLDDLDRRGVLAHTLVVITSDHGEHLGERQLYGHGTSLYRPELHVPLVILPPGGTAGRPVVAEPVSLRDLPATVAALVAPGAPSPFPGRSLAERWTPGPDPSRPDAEPVRSEVAAAPEDDPNRGRSPARRGPMTSLVAWGHHYVRNGDGREELFDLAADPGEARDLAPAPASAPTLGRFRAHLRR